MFWPRRVAAMLFTGLGLGLALNFHLHNSSRNIYERRVFRLQHIFIFYIQYSTIALYNNFLSNYNIIVY